MIIIEKIKAEIEKRLALQSLIKGEFAEGSRDALNGLLSFLSTLESKKPMKGLEEEIDRLWESFADEMEGPHNLFDIYARLARHFAEWGAEHLKIDVTDFCKPIDPSIAQCIADHSWEMLGEDEKPVLNNLEEAAHSYSESDEPLYSPGHRFHWDSDSLFGKQIETTFIAGAKWQAEQLLKSSPLPEDTVLFNKGVEEGKRLMMEEAVKWLVDDDYDELADKGGFSLGSVGIGYNGYYIPYSDLLKLPKEDEQ
jgi:hypothetical protein